MQSYAWLPDRRYETGIFFYKKYGVMMGGCLILMSQPDWTDKVTPKRQKRVEMGKDGKRQVSSVA